MALRTLKICRSISFSDGYVAFECIQTEREAQYSRSKMSLVAYDSSDEGSESEESEPTAPVATNDADNDATEAVAVQINSKLSLPAPRVSQSTNDEEDESDGAEHNFQQFLDTLPKPRDTISTENAEEVEDDILLKRETEGQILKPAKRQTVRISVPSLSEVYMHLNLC